MTPETSPCIVTIDVCLGDIDLQDGSLEEALYTEVENSEYE